MPSGIYIRTPKPLEERFWQKVKHKLNSDCLNWIGSKTNGGYGQFWIKGKLISAHRLAWELTFGKIPEELCVLHKCDNPSCVNPKHLFVGTQADNSKDMKMKNRSAKGEKHGRAKLKEHQICDILKSTLSGVLLAKKHGVTHQMIYDIKNRKNWRHIKIE